MKDDKKQESASQVEPMTPDESAAALAVVTRISEGLLPKKPAESSPEAEELTAAIP